jgi:diguanylate cyclase (GGDEF)-like protein/PAS domain S-box-containing protein
MNKSGLVIRLAIVIVFTALIVGLITTQLFSRFTFVNEQELGKQSIKQLFSTVSPTASIASYLNDKGLAEEVVNGLISNNIITAAAIQTETLRVESENYQKSTDSIAFDLFSPFQKDNKVGVLFVKINDSYLVAKANKISATNTFVVAIEALMITIISILVTYYVITQPILNIGKALHLIRPGTSERIKKPHSHQQSEIGQLADNVNNLLAKTEQQMLREKSLRNEVQVLESKFRMLFENATSAIVLVAPQGDILLYNEAFEKLIEKLNLSLKKSYGQYLEDLFIKKKVLHEQILIAFANNEPAAAELELISYQDEKVWVQVLVTRLITDNFQESYQITLYDISKSKYKISLLDQKANYDGLTHLLNRQAAEQHLRKLTEIHMPFALIMMDLNDFKPINDVFGHDSGDELLIHVSSQLLKVLRKDDVLSRWGGDEFVIILPNTSREAVIKVCAKLAAKLSKPYYLSQYDQSVFVTASMGVSFYPDDQIELLELIRSADKAMYQVKKDKSTNNDLHLAFTDEPTSIENDGKR